MARRVTRNAVLMLEVHTETPIPYPEENATSRASSFVSKGRKRAEHDADVAAALEAAGVDLICLAGYMRILSPGFVQRFAGRMLNIHPSLLPAFPGTDAHQQALAHGVKVSGCTVHLIDAGCDTGPILAQATVPVLPGDDVDTLQKRIMATETVLLPDVVARLSRGDLGRDGRVVWLPDP